MTARIELLERGRWQQLAARFQDHNYRQLWDFGVACAKRLGATSEHVAIADAEDVIGLADVRLKQVPLLRGGIAYVTGAPLVRCGDESLAAARLSACLQALIQEYVTRRKLLLRILPGTSSAEWKARERQVYLDCGFAPATTPQPYRTLVLDLARPLPEIRKSLAQKWRNCLNSAERNGVVVTAGNSPQLFADFCTLFEHTVQRKGFAVDLDAGFYAGVQAQLEEAERFRISMAYRDGQPIAGHVASLLGDTCVYLLGGSNELGMKLKASYLLQWHVISTAHTAGCRRYDLGGIDPEANPGVHHFKLGMGGEDLTSIPYEIRPASLRTLLVVYGERVYRLARRRYSHLMKRRARLASSVPAATRSD